MISSGQRVHLVGIGGMHMSAIAQLLLADGVSISGSDVVPSALTRRLETLGARVIAGHAAANVGDADLVVTTAAAKNDNVELIEARRRGIRILARHEMVARLMQGRIGLAVAGTHGKTTTSSLIAYVLRCCGKEPSFLLGGESPDLGGNAAAGAGPYIVVEADEYASAFLAYRPDVAVITNIEADHLDYFGTEAALVEAFRGFASRVQPAGALIACAESPLLRAMLASAAPGIPARLAWYSVEGDSDWVARDTTLELGKTSFTVERQGATLTEVHLSLPGRHNVANALAAFAAGYEVGLNAEQIAAAIGGFKGVHRRFELLGETGGITIIYFNAQHPTEIRATLLAARERYPNRRIVVMFQPHTYSRTQYLLDGFRCCFEGADAVYLLQTFAARETAEAGIDAHDLARALRAEPAGVVDSVAEATELIAALLEPGDVFLTIGAGNVTDIGAPVLEALRNR